MRRPRRWLDEGRVSADVRGLLERAGRSQALPDEVRTRSIARLDRYLVWPAAASLLLWLKGAAIAAGIGIAGVVAVAEIRAVVQPAPPVEVVQSEPRTSAPRAMAPRAPAVVPATPASIAPPSAAPADAPIERDRTPSPGPHASAPTTSAPSPAQPETDPLTREAAMLERARASLDRDPRASLAEIDACEAAFPSGTLRIERELLAAEALTRLGRREEARRRAEALLSSARGSIYEPRVRSMLEGLEGP